MLWFYLTLGCAVLFSLAHILNKRILASEEVIDLQVVEILFIVVLAASFFPLFEWNFDISMLLMPIIGAGAALGFYFLNKAYKACEISTVAPLLNINPLFILLATFLILGERLNTAQLSGVVLIIVGGYLLTIKDMHYLLKPFTSLPKRYFLLVLATLVIWSIPPTLSKIVLAEVDIYLYVFMFFFFIALTNLGLVLYEKRAGKIVPFFKRKWKSVLLVSVILFASDFLNFLAISLPGSMVSLVMPVKRSSNLLTVILGGQLFREKNIVLKSIACILMIAGLFLIAA